MSKRDYNAFEQLFKKLNLNEFIKYGTFNKICEDLLNKNGDVRQIIENFFLNNKLEIASNLNEESKINFQKRKTILLIDEVIIFII